MYPGPLGAAVWRIRTGRPQHRCWAKRRITETTTLHRKLKETSHSTLTRLLRTLVDKVQCPRGERKSLFRNSADEIGVKLQSGVPFEMGTPLHCEKRQSLTTSSHLSAVRCSVISPSQQHTTCAPPPIPASLERRFRCNSVPFCKVQFESSLSTQKSQGAKSWGARLQASGNGQNHNPSRMSKIQVLVFEVESLRIPFLPSN